MPNNNIQKSVRCLQIEVPIPSDSSEIIKNVRNKNCDLSTAILMLKQKNEESIQIIKQNDTTVQNSTNLSEQTPEQNLEDTYFPSPPPVSFEGLDTVSPDESVQKSLKGNSEKNSSDTEILSQGDKAEELSTEEEIHFSDDDEANNELVPLSHGVEVKAKDLNKCLIYGKTAKRLTRCLVDVLFPDLKLLSSCSAFGQKSNVTKLTRAALPTKKVVAILDYVQKRFPTATRTEIVLAINLKCKEARNIVDKQDGDKPMKETLFRRLLSKDQSYETPKSSPSTPKNSTPVSSTISNTSSNSTLVNSTPTIKIKTPVSTVTVVRQPVNQQICVKGSLNALTSTSENTTSSTNLVTATNFLKSSPHVLIRPKSDENKSDSLQPQIAQQTVRSLLATSQTLPFKGQFSDSPKILVPLESFQQSQASPTTNGPKPVTRIIIGPSGAPPPQTLPITQPSSLPSLK